jgi:hypothetical protein
MNRLDGKVASLNLELIGAEAARHAKHPKALDYILRGRHAVELSSIRSACLSIDLRSDFGIDASPRGRFYRTDTTQWEIAFCTESTASRL